MHGVMQVQGKGLVYERGCAAAEVQRSTDASRSAKGRCVKERGHEKVNGRRDADTEKYR